MCLAVYRCVRSHNETYLIAALTSSNFRRDIFFHVLHNRKNTEKYQCVCIMWRKVMNSKGYFYDSDNDDQDNNDNSPFYDMH